MNINMNKEKRSPYFDKQTTSILKGIALIMMFVHHFFTFPKWWIAGQSYPLLEVVGPYFCRPLKLCVAVFAFLTGYFYYYNKNKSYKYSLKKISDILISYWFVFVIFALIAVVFVDYKYTTGAFVKEFLTLHRPTMTFCWYVYFYIFVMLLFPLIVKIMSFNIHIDLILSLGIVPMLLGQCRQLVADTIFDKVVYDLTAWYPIVLIGYIFACYGLFEKMDVLLLKNAKLNLIICIGIALIIPMGRYVEPTIVIKSHYLPALSISMDNFYAPVFIYAVVNICKTVKLNHAKTVLCQIGKYSLQMWFVSCIFFNNSRAVFQPILYYPRNPILVTVWGLLICFGVSWIFDRIIGQIQGIKNRVFFK